VGDVVFLAIFDANDENARGRRAGRPVLAAVTCRRVSLKKKVTAEASKAALLSLSLLRVVLMPEQDRQTGV
jgi:hypothetical protein